MDISQNFFRVAFPAFALLVSLQTWSKCEQLADHLKKLNTQTKNFSPKYVRDEWIRRIKKTERTQRSLILSQRSLQPIRFADKDRLIVKSGYWEDFYYDGIYTEADKLDIDHVVPIKNAHLSGAANWSKKMKQDFAHDPNNLVITNKSFNQSKGAKGIDQWLPRNYDYACKYIKAYIKIKKKYKLLFTEGEQQTIEQFADCLN